ncbi:hypothetical protein BSKO_01607 [Bryopsis sp. KO-2023]|nr:hypothetical protein BSKO_01607 [Bryopsis sp. KO-2023]
MEIKMKGTLSLDGKEPIEHTVEKAESVSQGILYFKEKLMVSITEYITENNLASAEVDLFEENLEDIDGRKGKRNHGKGEESQKKRQKGPKHRTLGRKTR